MATDKRQRQRANREHKYQQQTKQVRRNTLKRRVLTGLGIVVGGLALVLLIAWLGGAFSDDEEATPTTTVAPALPNGFTLGTGACPPEEGVTEPVRTFDDAPSLCIDPEAGYTATFQTNLGEIVAELDTINAPGTVNNFVTLARYGYYDDTLIFRADPSIDIVQGGGRANTDTPGYNIPDEGAGFRYREGQLVMARTGAPDSAGGQWFIVGGPDASNLDGAGTYVVFGEVTSGLDIVQDIIASVDTNGPPPDEVVVETVTITEGQRSAAAGSTPPAAGTTDAAATTTPDATTEATEPAISGPATTGPATTGPATSEPATSEPATSG